MNRTQQSNTTNGKIGELTANSAYFAIETEGDVSDLNSEPSVLYCLDAANPTNGIEIGRFKSLAGAQNEADGYLAADRKTPPKLTWEEA